MLHRKYIEIMHFYTHPRLVCRRPGKLALILLSRSMVVYGNAMLPLYARDDAMMGAAMEVANTVIMSVLPCCNRLAVILPSSFWRALYWDFTTAPIRPASPN